MSENKSSRGWKIRQTLKRILSHSMDGYTIFLLVYFAFRVFFGDGFWPVLFLGNFIHWLLLPVFVLLVMALWRRRRWAIVANGALVFAFVGFFGTLFLPNVAASSESATVFRVMAFNAWVGSAPPAQLIPLLRDSEADFIALEELGIEEAEAIERDLQTAYPYQVLYGENGVRGKGLLSRYPVLEHERLNDFAMSHLRAVVDVDGVPLTIIVAHPPRPDLNLNGYTLASGFAEEIAALVELSTTGDATIMMGDFNMADQNDHYARLVAAGLTDSFRAGGWGFGATWPVNSGFMRLGLPPLVRIDYVWHTAHFQTVNAWVGPDAGSDHLPVLADLVWTTDE